MDFKKILATIIFGVLSTQAIVFDCEYGLNVWVYFGEVYTCTARVLVINNGDEIIGVTNNHTLGKTNSDVEALSIGNQKMATIPTGIDKYFTNLKILRIISSQLRTISGADLSPFQQLKYVSLYSNNLEALNYDLFFGMSNIEYVSFRWNQISNVGQALLDPLINLKEIDFRENICIDSEARNQSEISSLKHHLNIKCPTSLKMFESSIVNSESFRKKLQELESSLMERIEKLEKKIERMELN